MNIYVIIGHVAKGQIAKGHIANGHIAKGHIATLMITERHGHGGIQAPADGTS